jgi:hypothetical protein
MTNLEVEKNPYYQCAFSYMLVDDKGRGWKGQWEMITGITFHEWKIIYFIHLYYINYH